MDQKHLKRQGKRKKKKKSRKKKKKKKKSTVCTLSCPLIERSSHRSQTLSNHIKNSAMMRSEKE